MVADIIHVLDRKVLLRQPEGAGFRTSLDSVMLAAACPALSGNTVLDAGCGVGGAGLCLSWRVPGIHLTGLDWNEDYLELARQNGELNKCSASWIAGDIRHFQPQSLFDHVIINPPYFEAGCHTPSPDKWRAQANGHQEADLSLDDWIKAAHRLLKSKGSLTLIYPAPGTDRIFQSLGRKFGAVELIPLWPRQNTEAKRVIVRAVKDRQTPARILPGITLHEATGAYTQETEKILRDGAFIR